MGKTNITGIIFIAGIIVFVLAASVAYSALVEVQTSEGMPPNPHETENFLESECAACHGRGIARAPLFDHPEMENCLACHTYPGEGGDDGTPDLVVPHPVDGTYEDCISCHEGGAIFSYDVPHAMDSSYADCASCHFITQE